jgi:hypothetical protein
MVGEKAVPYVRYNESAEEMNAPYVKRSTPAPSAKQDGYDVRTRFGFRAAGALQALDIGSGYDAYIGSALSVGIARSIPFSPRVTFEIEANYLYRSLAQTRTSSLMESGEIKVFLEESAINMPLMLRLATAHPGKFAFYAEGGIAAHVPFGTGLRIDGSDSGPIKIRDRNAIEFPVVYGSGVSFKAGMTYYIGFRNVIDFDEQLGTLIHLELGLTMMF